MRFIRHNSGHGPRLAVLGYGRVRDVHLLLRREQPIADLAEFLALPSVHAMEILKDINDRLAAVAGIAESTTHLLAPIVRPPKILCVGLNYRSHVAEQNAKPPEAPLFFNKAPTAILDPEGAIVRPSETQSLDYECELAAVIGRRLETPADLLEAGAVFGYTMINDVTARDLQKSDRQWFRAKSFRTFAPLGPVVVTPDEIDPQNVRLRTILNGQVVQDGNTSDMVFSVKRLLQALLAFVPLEPGDVIATGTPAGVGAYKLPAPRFLQPGDVVEVEGEGVGTLRNRVVEGGSG